MANTSATGGYLTATTSPLDDQALARFMHGVICGVTGLANELVRPAWQRNPPPRPNHDIRWCGFGVSNHIAESGNSFTKELDTGLGAEQHRTESFDLSCSFYGSGCMSVAASFRDGLELSQNREQLFLVEMGYVGADQITRAPELINEIWYDRADITLTFRRVVRKEYAVLNFLNAYGTYTTDTGLSGSWSTQGLTP